MAAARSARTVRRPLLYPLPRHSRSALQASSLAGRATGASPILSHLPATDHSPRAPRFFLANTEELHDEIDRQKTRIRELEQALRDVQNGMIGNAQPRESDPTYPLASSSNPYPTPSDAGPSSGRRQSRAGDSMEGSHMPEIVRPAQDEESLLDAFGTLTLDGNGAARFLGNTARPEVRCIAILHLVLTDDDS